MLVDPGFSSFQYFVNVQFVSLCCFIWINNIRINTIWTFYCFFQDLVVIIYTMFVLCLFQIHSWLIWFLQFFSDGCFWTVVGVGGSGTPEVSPCRHWADVPTSARNTYTDCLVWIKPLDLVVRRSQLCGVFFNQLFLKQQRYHQENFTSVKLQ